MIDVTIVGGGLRVKECSEVLSRAGFNTVHSFSIETGNRSPIILGELQGGFQVAREAVASGRHILIAGSQAQDPERLALLMEHRRQAQALFIWNERRFHPGYRLLGGLIEADNTWHPRYVRHQTLSTELTTSPALRWQTLEGIALTETLLNEEPRRVTASAVINPRRNAADLYNLQIFRRDVESLLLSGMGEPLDRRETVVASDSRKAFVDELNEATPIHITEDSPVGANPPRRISYSAPSRSELARQQCVAFLDATLHASETQAEATLWLRALSILEAADASIATGAPADVLLKQEDHRFRVIRNIGENPSSVA